MQCILYVYIQFDTDTVIVFEALVHEEVTS